MKNTCRVLVGKPQGKTPLGIRIHRQHGYLNNPSFFIFFFCLLFFCFLFFGFLNFSLFCGNENGLEITNFRSLQSRIKIRQNPPTVCPVEAYEGSDSHDTTRPSSSVGRMSYSQGI